MAKKCLSMSATSFLTYLNFFSYVQIAQFHVYDSNSTNEVVAHISHCVLSRVVAKAKNSNSVEYSQIIHTAKIFLFLSLPLCHSGLQPAIT